MLSLSKREKFFFCRGCGDHERIDLFFTVKNWQGEKRTSSLRSENLVSSQGSEIKNMEPEKCDDLSWFPLNDLPKNTIPYIRKAIECYKEGISYCEFGWENKAKK